MKIRKGSLILVKPDFSRINFKNFIFYGIAKACRGFTHIAMAFGNGKIADFDFPKFRILSTKEFIKKYDKFSKATLYILKPINSTPNKINNLIKNVDKYTVGYSVLHLFRLGKWIKNGMSKVAYNLPEPISLKNFAVCSTFIASLLKSNSIDIGKRGSIAFIPSTFIFSSYFKLVKKINIGGKK